MIVLLAVQHPPDGRVLDGGCGISLSLGPIRFEL